MASFNLEEKELVEILLNVGEPMNLKQLVKSFTGDKATAPLVKSTLKPLLDSAVANGSLIQQNGYFLALRSSSEKEATDGETESADDD